MTEQQQTQVEVFELNSFLSYTFPIKMILRARLYNDIFLMFVSDYGSEFTNSSAYSSKVVLFFPSLLEVQSATNGLQLIVCDLSS